MKPHPLIKKITFHQQVPTSPGPIKDHSIIIGDRDQARRDRDQARRDCGLVRGRDSTGHVIWE